MDTDKIINAVIKREVLWRNGKCEDKPSYGEDIEKGIVIEGSFRHWERHDKTIYLSTWFVRAN